MQKSWRIILMLLILFGVSFSAMAWISRAALDLDRSEVQARRQAHLEENVRLALWRMDTALTPLVASKNTIPAVYFRPTFTIDDILKGGGIRPSPTSKILSSPLSSETHPYVKLYFQLSPDGAILSPQLPEQPSESAEDAVTVARRLLAKERLEDLRQILDFDDLVTRLPDDSFAPSRKPGVEISTRIEMKRRSATDERNEERGVREKKVQAGDVTKSKPAPQIPAVDGSRQVRTAIDQVPTAAAAGSGEARDAKRKAASAPIADEDSMAELMDQAAATGSVAQAPQTKPQAFQQKAEGQQQRNAMELDRRARRADESANEARRQSIQNFEQLLAVNVANQELDEEEEAPADHFYKDSFARSSKKKAPRSAKAEPEATKAKVSSTVQAPAAERAKARTRKKKGKTKNRSALVKKEIREARLTESGMNVALFKPLWQNGRLLLMRKLVTGDGLLLQGCWLDWEAIRAWLLDEVTDLLPGASLSSITLMGDDDRGRLLAALPAVLVPSAMPEPIEAGLSPIQLALIIGWICAILAALAAAILLIGALNLSERRGAFVSAVTHELRTPLTTFRMYTEMLARGIVDGEEKRTRYLNTLHREAERLGHLVENVLSYARLEKGRKPGALEIVILQDLIERSMPVLKERAEACGLCLEVEGLEEYGELKIQAAAPAVERILFNLVDNAGKYAGDAKDNRIVLSLDTVGRNLRFKLRDFGPGISPKQASRLFKPFSKSAFEAADSAPGIGLGLALCRQLAMQMGGKLTHERPSDGGACFSLLLRLA